MKHNLLCLRTFCIIAALVCLSTIHTWAASKKNPEAVTAMLNRIGGEGAASRFETVLDASLTSNGKDAFTITSQSGKPCIKGVPCWLSRRVSIGISTIMPISIWLGTI